MADWLPDIAELASTGSDFMSSADMASVFSPDDPIYSDWFVENLGDVVGPAMGLLKTGAGAASSILGGGGGSGEMGGSPTGFVNKALTAAETFQVGQISRQAAERAPFFAGKEGNRQSLEIVAGIARRRPNGVKAAGNALMSVALKSGSRAELRARATG